MVVVGAARYGPESGRTRAASSDPARVRPPGRSRGLPFDDWARELGLDPAQASATLARHDLVHRDARSGAVIVAYPFSATPTRHRVRLRGEVEVFAMCAIDALGVGFMLGDAAEIASADPRAGEPIEITVRPTGASTWSPATAVVVAGCVGTGASRTCMCPHTNFAASREHAAALLEANRVVVGEILSMPEAIARGHECFGGLLDDDPQEVAVAHGDRA